MTYTLSDPAIPIQPKLCDSSIRPSANLSLSFRPVELFEENITWLPSDCTFLPCQLPHEYGLEGSMSRCQHITSQKQSYIVSPPLFSYIASLVSPTVVLISPIPSGPLHSYHLLSLSSTYTDTAKSRADLPR
jgi:hypothetical protein